MPYKTVKQFLVGATQLPAAIEGKLPAGAPKVSGILVDTANRLPDGPEFPVEVPDLPAPMLPDLPAMPGGGGLGLAPRPKAERGKTVEKQPVVAAASYVGKRGQL